jgi:hypothetical protein
LLRKKRLEKAIFSECQALPTDHASKKDAAEINLTLRPSPCRRLVEVAALRLYTTSTFKLVNGPLRDSGIKNADEVHKEPHPLAVTTYHITAGLKKLRALNFNNLTSSIAQGEQQLVSTRDSSTGSPSPTRKTRATTPSSPPRTKRAPSALTRPQSESTLRGQYLWRGMKNLAVSDQFMTYGGSELGCMSTSEDLNVIARYALSSRPLLIRIKIESPMDRGANLKWLSVFPHEEEVLYPPLTFLKPLLKQKIHGMVNGTVITLKAVFPS